MSPLSLIDKQTITKHVIKLTSGAPGSALVARGGEEQIREILESHVQDFLIEGGRDILIIAQSGLQDDRTVVRETLEQVGWWLDNGIYPVYVLWEPGFLDALMQSVLPNIPYSRPPRYEPLESDVMWGQLINRTMEKVARGPGMIFWERMNENARDACAEGSALQGFVRCLKGILTQRPDIRVHAMGHSAGAILLTHFFALARIEDLPSFNSAYLLAPSVSIPLFRAATLPLVGSGKGIDKLTVFVLNERDEEEDVCEWKGVVGYHRSFLHWVHSTFERDRQKILGLDIHVQPDVQITSRVDFVRGNTDSPSHLACGARRHMDFAADRLTMENVVERMTGKVSKRVPSPNEIHLNGLAPTPTLDLHVNEAPLPTRGLDQDRVANLLRSVADLLDGRDARSVIEAMIADVQAA